MITWTDHALDELFDALATLDPDDRIGVFDKPSSVIHESLTRGLVSARTVAPPGAACTAPGGGEPSSASLSGAVPPFETSSARLSPGAA